MRNTLIIGIYAPFAMVTAIIFCVELFRHYKRQEDYFFTLLCFYALGWYTVSIGGLLTSSVAVAEYCTVVILVFVSLITPTLLLFIIRFYKLELPVRLPRRAPALLFVIPAITSLLTVTSGSHHLVFTQLEILSLSPVRDIVLVWGPWFWVHTVYSYILSIIIITLIVYQHWRVTHFYRLPSSMMVLGVSITLVGNLVTLFQVIPPIIEPTLITMSLSLIFFSLAIFNNNNSKFVRYSKAHIYNYLAEYILVLDENNLVIDYNKAAGEWFASQGIGLDASSLDNVSKQLLLKGEIIQRDSGEDEEEEQGVDIRIKDQMFPLVLNQRIYQMKGARGDSIGKIVVYSDVTQTRTLIERLETKAGVDSLTGIPNHMAYVGAKGRLKARAYLPLSAIVCDANGLKRVNDSMGHSYGDLLIQTAASILESECPPGGFVGRTGGDEFVFLLPRTEPEAVQELIERIRERFLEVDGLPFPLSMAFGAATRWEESQPIEELIAQADERMYEDKRNSQSSVVNARSVDNGVW